MAWKKFVLDKEAQKWSITLAMKVSPSARPHAASSAASLRIRTAETPADWQIAHRMLDEEHLLGAGREADLRKLGLLRAFHLVGAPVLAPSRSMTTIYRTSCAICGLP